MAKVETPLPESHAMRIEGGKPIKRKVRANGWTAQRRKRFLDCVAATCNIGQSAAFAGMSLPGMYALRRRDADFADQLRQALETGYTRIEASLLNKVTNGSSVRVPLWGDEELDGKPPTLDDIKLPDPDDVDPDVALRILQFHYRMVKDPAAPRRSGRPPAHATKDETNAALVKRLRALDRRLRKEAENEQKRAANN